MMIHLRVQCLEYIQEGLSLKRGEIGMGVSMMPLG